MHITGSCLARAMTHADYAERIAEAVAEGRYADAGRLLAQGVEAVRHDDAAIERMGDMLERFIGAGRGH